MNRNLIRLILVFSIVLMTQLKVECQTTMPDVLIKGTLNEQLKYLEERTRIYENYRAIREDMFQKMKGNISDSLSITNRKIEALNLKTLLLNRKIDSLSTSLVTTKVSLGEITSTKNSIKVVGIEVNKSAYNTIMWTIIAGLIVIVALGFLIFQRNLSNMHSTKKEFDDLKEEFNTYKTTTREAREKASMAHFLEIKKLKGG